MSRKPQLSPTRLSTYLACPIRYGWTYLDARGKFYLRSRKAFSFGTTLHRVLERFHDANDQGVETVHEAVAALEESWIDAGFHSPEEMSEAFGDGVAILERHIEGDERRTVSSKTISVEKNLKVEFPRFQLVGRLDRIDEHEDGTLEIIDYKSGRWQVTDQDVATDLTMCLYQLMLSDLYPGRPIRATLLALRTGAQGSASLTPAQLTELRADVELLGNEILDLRFLERTPVPKRLCGSCEFVSLCRRHVSFSEAEMAAR